EQRRVRIGRVRELADQEWKQRRKLLAGKGPCQRPHIASQPPAYERRRFKRLPEAERRKPVKGFVIVSISRKLEPKLFCFNRPHSLEQASVMPLHVAQVLKE